MVIALALRRCKVGNDKALGEMFGRVVEERTGLQLDQIVGSMVSDRAAKGVAKQSNMEEVEVCEMHDTDKERHRKSRPDKKSCGDQSLPSRLKLYKACS